jgi:hypothetical protein
MDDLQKAYLDVYQELDEAMAPGTNKDKMIALANHPRTTTQDRGNIHNIAVRNDTGPSYTKKSTGGKGSRFPGYGDQGAGNKASRRAGNEPMRGNRDPRQQAEEFDLFDYLLEYLVAEGYANTNENAIAIMANMSEDWKQNIIDEAYKDFPTAKVMKKAGDLMGSSAGKDDEKSKNKEKRGVKMMDTMMQHSPDR